MKYTRETSKLEKENISKKSKRLKFETLIDGYPPEKCIEKESL